MEIPIKSISFVKFLHLIQTCETRRSEEILKWVSRLKVAFLSFTPEYDLGARHFGGIQTLFPTPTSRICGLLRGAPDTFVIITRRLYSVVVFMDPTKTYGDGRT